MSRPTKPEDAEEWLGVLKTLDDVPGRWRFYQYADAYVDEDTFSVFCEDEEYARGSHARYEEEVDRAGDHWKSFMAERERHHALARPEDVEMWCVALLNGKSLRRAHDYFLRVRRFYDWLQNEVQPPHRYHPVLMAANEGEAASRIWQYKTRQTRESRREYRSQGEPNE